MIKAFIFTFGFGHVDGYGNSLANTYAKVWADDWYKAQEVMCMHHGQKWAFQYEDEESAGVQRWNLRQVYEYHA